MAANYWAQPAALHRKVDPMTVVPDGPIRGTTEKVADGSLSEMLDRWAALPPSDRPRHAILVGGGALGDSAMEALVERHGSAEGRSRSSPS